MRAGVQVPGPGETRLCREPWIAPAVRADGIVMRCCFGGLDFGDLNADDSLLTVLNGEVAREARSRLLEGRLDAGCRNCTRFPIVSLEEYRTHIAWLIQQGRNQVPQDEATDFLAFTSPETVWMEFTSRCNLRCTYCAQSNGSYVSHDLPRAAVDRVIDDIIRLGVPHVSLTGGGENTLDPSWQEHANRLLDAGIKLSIITNLARPISDAEAAIFARMGEVCVSLDAVDRAVLKAIRTADNRIVLANVAKIMAARVIAPNPDFKMRWATVISLEASRGLRDLVATGIAMGVAMFEFMALIAVPNESELQQKRRPRTLDELDQKDVKNIADAVDQAHVLIRERIGEEGIVVQAGLRSALAQALLRVAA